MIAMVQSTCRALNAGQRVGRTESLVCTVTADEASRLDVLTNCPKARE